MFIITTYSVDFHDSGIVNQVMLEIRKTALQRFPSGFANC